MCQVVLNFVVKTVVDGYGGPSCSVDAAHVRLERFAVAVSVLISVRHEQVRVDQLVLQGQYRVITPAGEV